jgi:hypothetical protein
VAGRKRIPERCLCTAGGSRGVRRPELRAGLRITPGSCSAPSLVGVSATCCQNLPIRQFTAYALPPANGGVFVATIGSLCDARLPLCRHRTMAAGRMGQQGATCSATLLRPDPHRTQEQSRIRESTLRPSAVIGIRGLRTLTDRPTAVSTPANTTFRGCCQRCQRCQRPTAITWRYISESVHGL